MGGEGEKGGFTRRRSGFAGRDAGRPRARWRMRAVSWRKRWRGSFILVFSGGMNYSDSGVVDMLKVLGKENQCREYFLLIPPFESRHRAINLVSTACFYSPRYSICILLLGYLDRLNHSSFRFRKQIRGTRGTRY